MRGLGSQSFASRAHTVPGQAVSLAASPKRAPPEVDDMVPERHERPAVCRDRVVGEVARHDLPQPSPLFGDGLVPASPHLLLHVLKFRSQAVAPGLPLEQEFALARLPQMNVNPRNLNVSGLPTPRFSRFAAAKRPNSIRRVFSGWSVSANCLKPRPHRIKEATSIALFLEADNQIIGVAHDDHVAGGLVPSPARGPQVETVVQVDIRQER